MFDVCGELASLAAQGLLRELETPRGVDFASNDYLGLSHNQTIQEGLIRFLKSASRLGSTGSRLITGQCELCNEVEALLAQHFNADAALLFGSGYLANIGVCNALSSPETEFFSDELNHASLIDGLRLSKSNRQIFCHNDIDDLENRLLKSRSSRKVIVTEHLFSMDGDFAPIAPLLSLAVKYDCYLVVDAAHTTGIYDLELNGYPKALVIHTCGKALGAYGAFVTSSIELKNLMLNKSRTQIFSTALPPVTIEHIRLAVQYLQSSNIQAEFRQSLRKAHRGFARHSIKTSDSQIIPVVFGNNALTLKAAEHLKASGYFVKAIRSPTVAAGSERLRVTIQAHQTEAQIEAFVNKLSEVTDEYLRYRN